MEASADVQPTEPGTGADAPKKKTIPLLAVIGVGLLVGAGLGMFVAGPAVAAKFAPKPAADAAHAGADSAAGDEKKGAAQVLHVVDNLVLNPAGSGGTRFLMVTATFEVKDAAAAEEIKVRDAEVRDALLALLGRKSVDELTDMTRRDGIKTEVIGAIAPLFKKGTISKVFFPQFVIQ